MNTETSETSVETTEVETRASGAQIAAMIGLIVAYVGISYYFEGPRDSSDVDALSNFVGLMIGAMLWPIIIAGIAAIWEKNRTPRAIVQHMSYVVIALAIIKVLANVVIPASQAMT